MEELSEVATEIALINNGTILDIGTTEELLHKLAADHIEIHFSAISSDDILIIEDYVLSLNDVAAYEIHPNSLTMIGSQGQQILSRTLKFLIQNDLDIEFSQLKQATLNDVYLSSFNEKESPLCH